MSLLSMLLVQTVVDHVIVSSDSEEEKHAMEYIDRVDQRLQQRLEKCRFKVLDDTYVINFLQSV